MHLQHSGSDLTNTSSCMRIEIKGETRPLAGTSGRQALGRRHRRTAASGPDKRGSGHLASRLANIAGHCRPATSDRCWLLLKLGLLSLPLTRPSRTGATGCRSAFWHLLSKNFENKSAGSDIDAIPIVARRERRPTIWRVRDAGSLRQARAGAAQNGSIEPHPRVLM